VWMVVRGFFEGPASGRVDEGAWMVESIWGKVKEELRGRLAQRHFAAWIEPARAGSYGAISGRSSSVRSEA
jgi:hypothetical protein